jgi:multisubunit Na+/H+ antiporter MnhB subunit
MVPIWALALLVGISLVAVVVMLAMRRFRAPEGFINDPVPPAGVFGVLGVALAVLLAFVLFLAFEGFVHAQEGSSREAVAVTQLLRATRLFPAPENTRLRGELVCYGRAVVSDEWPKMAAGGESQLVENWIATIETTVDRTPVNNARAQVALSHWLDEMTERREGRRARLAEASTSIPGLVWLMLILGSAATVLYLLVFADRRERWWVQGAMMGTIAGMVVSTLLVIHFLDNPFTPNGTYIAPTEMQTTLRLFEHQLSISGEPSVTFPCDERGNPSA